MPKPVRTFFDRPLGGNSGPGGGWPPTAARDLVFAFCTARRGVRVLGSQSRVCWFFRLVFLPLERESLGRFDAGLALVVPRTEPLQVGGVVIVSALNVVAVGALCWASGAVVEGCLAPASGSPSGLVAQVLPVFGELLASCAVFPGGHAPSPCSGWRSPLLLLQVFPSSWSSGVGVP